YKDAWFIGFTADLVAGVWLGNDDNTPMNKVTGGTLPAPVWKNFMLVATQGVPIKPLPGAPLQGGAAEAPPATDLGHLFGRVAAPGPPTPLIPIGTVLPRPRD